MKLLLSFFIINSIYSCCSFGDTGTLERTLSKEFTFNENIEPIVESIANDTIDPFFEFILKDGNETVQRIKGRSVLFSKILTDRLIVTAPLGDEEANLKALKIIISKGLDLSNLQPSRSIKSGPLDEYNNISPSILASNTCNMNAINILKSHNVNFSNLFNAYLPLRRSYNTDPGSREEKACNDVLKENIISGGNWDITSVYHFFNGKMELNNNEFIDGALLDPMPDEIKTLLRSKYGIVFSKRPNTIEPDEKEFELMRDQLTFAEHNHDDKYKSSGVYWEKWWPQSSPDRKAWLCYYSSFDEAVSALKFAGWSEDDLASKNIPHTSYTNFKLKSPPIGNFAVKTFVQYCNSIK